MPEQSMLRRQRWVIFSTLALMYILVYFYRVSLAVVAGDITRDLRLTPQQLGSLAGVLFYVYAFAQLPLGPMIDRLGSRRVISGCGILTTIGGILFSTADNLSVAMAARVLIGAGTASVLMATLAVFSHWFTRHEFGRVSGFMVAVGNLGNLTGTGLLALAVAIIGWRRSFMAIALLQALVTVLVFLMVRDRPPLSHDATADHEKQENPGMLATWRDIFSTPDFWLLGIIAFFWYGSYLAVQGLWGGPYLMEVMHRSRTETGRLLMIIPLGFIVGSMAIDTLARKLFHSYKKALVTGQIALLVLMSCFLGMAEKLSEPLLAAAFFALGLAVSSGVMIYPIIRSMFPVRIVGTALTSLNFFVLMGAAVAQHVMGMIVGMLKLKAGVTLAEAFHTAFLFPVVGLAAAIVLYLFARDYSERGL